MSDLNTEMSLPDFQTETDDITVGTDDQQQQKTAADLAPVFDVPVNIQAVLGKTAIDVASLLRLNRGSVLELDRKVGEAIDIYVNNRLVARGEVVVIDNRLGVTMTEIIKDGDAV
jgi:flagellar motor switch protein FliN